MSIFDKFNNQGLDNDAAFEELCCQLFENWGTHEKKYGNSWTYRDIRGSGGDGGIEAYWRNETEDSCIAIQAKWFRNTLSPSQLRQIRDSINDAMSLRPKLERYIVCLPHNLTSMKNVRNGKTSEGEDKKWRDLENEIATKHPNLVLELWDESAIHNRLTRSENEGYWRFWFSNTLVNPDQIDLCIKKAIEGLRNRYVPKLVDAGELSSFLDRYFGTPAARSAILKDINKCLVLCKELSTVLISFDVAGKRLPDALRQSAMACAATVNAYSNVLEAWEELVKDEPTSIIEIDHCQIDFTVIDRFEYDIRDLKNQYELQGHVDSLLKLLDKLKEAPSEWEIASALRNMLGSPHCLVIGEQGTGKTCGFIDKVRDYCGARRHLPVFIRAAEIQENSWKDAVARALGLGNDWDETALWQALSASAAIRDEHSAVPHVRAKVAVLVDGIDEVSTSSFWDERIRKADAISKSYPRIRFAFSSRPSGVLFDGDEDLMKCIHRVERTGDVPVHKLFDRYIEYYDIRLDGSTKYKWLLRTPMELNMFCTAYRGRTVSKDVSTCVTGLVDAEIKRLEQEYRDRYDAQLESHATPVRNSLIALARTFLQDDTPLGRQGIEGLLVDAGSEAHAVGGMLDFMESYGILAVASKPGKTPFSPSIVSYSPGSRHLWDYFMAFLLIENGSAEGMGMLANRLDAVEMYAILLVEKDGVLPIDSPAVVSALGEKRAYEMTINALSHCHKDLTRRYVPWVREELKGGEEHFSNIVNNLVLSVSNEDGHPLGPTLLDEFLRSFPRPIDRDAVWSLPKSRSEDRMLAMYYERDMISHMPRLHSEAKNDQMPLILAWGLSALSNLKRRHCRSELVRWGMSNAGEFVRLFTRFCECDDPQIREDMFAIAEEVVCGGSLPPDAEAELGRLVSETVFATPDEPGNRNAALRYYGCLLLDRCYKDSLIDKATADHCKPPYTVDGENALPIYPDACNSTRMGGYGSIGYDLARYVLVDKIERAFGIPYRYHADGQWKYDDVNHLVEVSAAEKNIGAPSIEAWLIAAAYQYMIEHGYDRNVFEGFIGDSGYRTGGIDRMIIRSFGSTDHGTRSTVMTVAEKYVWCARNEICGYLADRIPVESPSWLVDDGEEPGTLTTDYGTLLDFDSPFFETTVNELETKRANILLSFPEAFACDDGFDICRESDLRAWIDETPVEAATSLIGHAPNVRLRIDGDVIPISLYACDWSPGGKESKVWIYGGVANTSEVSKLEFSETAEFTGYDAASDFSTGLYRSMSTCYTSPVELMAASWKYELDEPGSTGRIADAHIDARPLSGSSVGSLIDIGDYYYRYPSEYARRLCDVVRTDGSRYLGIDGDVVYEDIKYGENYRHDYEALLAKKDLLTKAVENDGCVLVWYVTVRREANHLAKERIPDPVEGTERSWIVWKDKEGIIKSCLISDTYPKPKGSSDTTRLVEELLASYRSQGEPSNKPEKDYPHAYRR